MHFSMSFGLQIIRVADVCVHVLDNVKKQVDTRNLLLAVARGLPPPEHGPVGGTRVARHLLGLFTGLVQQLGSGVSRQLLL